MGDKRTVEIHPSKIPTLMTPIFIVPVHVCPGAIVSGPLSDKPPEIVRRPAATGAADFAGAAIGAVASGADGADEPVVADCDVDDRGIVVVATVFDELPDASVDVDEKAVDSAAAGAAVVAVTVSGGMVGTATTLTGGVSVSQTQMGSIAGSVVVVVVSVVVVGISVVVVVVVVVVSGGAGVTHSQTGSSGCAPARGAPATSAMTSPQQVTSRRAVVRRISLHLPAAPHQEPCRNDRQNDDRNRNCHHHPRGDAFTAIAAAGSD